MKKPNIVLIMADDMGYWSMGCAGNREIRTPNLDELAKEGMLFENCFCASPVCSPARASILCGKMPSQHGVHDWLCRGYVNYEEEVSPELKAEHQNPAASWEYDWSRQQLAGDRAVRYLDGFRAYTDILAENGYACGLSGKWHLGDSGHAQKGFSYWKTIAMGGDNYYYPIVLQNGQFTMLRGTYITDYITENALGFLEGQTDGRPFYLSVHCTAPHSPWDERHHPAEFYHLYDGCAFTETPDVPPHKWGGSYTPEQRKQWLQGYYAAVSAMDAGIGKIMRELKSRGLWQDTIFIFTADNGMSMGHHGIFGKGNGTFPMNLYDTAVKVPLIISYPQAIRGGSVAKGLYCHYDIMPTIAGMMGETLGEGFPGRSFQEIFEGKIPAGRESIVVFDEYGPARMIRTAEYKYIHRYPYGPHEFYDLKADPEENENLIDTNDPALQSVIAQMKNQMEQWFIRYTDPDKDGTKQAVCGLGQLSPVGGKGMGRQAFIQK